MCNNPFVSLGCSCTPPCKIGAQLCNSFDVSLMCRLLLHLSQVRVNLSYLVLYASCCCSQSQAWNADLKKIDGGLTCNSSPYSASSTQLSPLCVLQLHTTCKLGVQRRSMFGLSLVCSLTLDAYRHRIVPSQSVQCN